MSEDLKNLKKDYIEAKNNAVSSEEKQQIKENYKEMKDAIKVADKLLKDAEKDEKQWNKMLDKLGNEYDKMVEGTKNFKPTETTKTREIDNLIKDIDKKIEEIDNMEGKNE